MCYVRLDPDEIPSRGRELTTAEWIRLGEQAVDAGTLFLTITGGEPLVRPDFADIYTAFTEMGFWIALQTNLSLIDDKIMALLEERPPKLIKSTIYGASDETYQRVCGVKNGLQRVKNGLEMIKKAGISLTLVSTVIHENEAELNAIHQLAAEYGYPLQHTHGVMDSKRNNNHDQIVASRIQYQDLSDEQKAEVHLSPHPAITSPLELCGNYVNGGYWILWNGHMSLCSHIDMKYEPLNTSIDICFSKMIQQLDRQYSATSCYQCSNTNDCRACPAILYLEGIDPKNKECQNTYITKLCKN